MKRKMRSYSRPVLLGFAILLVLVLWQSVRVERTEAFARQLWGLFQNSLYERSMATHMPVIGFGNEEETEKGQGSNTVANFLTGKVKSFLPVYAYTENLIENDPQVEGRFPGEMASIRGGEGELHTSENPESTENIENQEGSNHSENLAILENLGSIGTPDSTPESISGEDSANLIESSAAGPSVAAESMEQAAISENIAAQAVEIAEAAPVLREKLVEIPMAKLGDFDYLIQNFYHVDKTTSINSEQLNAAEMAAQDLRLQVGNDQPQILIYHTHVSETYADSDGTPATTVAGVGEKLAGILREQYGLNVIHDIGVYDSVRDKAYSVAAPNVEGILAAHPSIEVIVDLHRDGVDEETRLVAEVDGKPTAKIMFFNGLSRTTKAGDIAYLANPNLATNLAFSFQMNLAAQEYYPGWSRGIYLKGYRYNLHYRPKDILVEVGAQTSTVEEAMNAMEPLADLLHMVLVGQ